MIGILGGGQLGKMLGYTLIRMDLDFKILDPDTECVCAKNYKNFEEGDWKDEEAVYQFGKNCEIVTLEIEHVNTKALHRLEKEGVKVYPSASVIETIQDKALQKTFFKENGLPTAEFEIYNSKDDFIKKAKNSGIVWKKATLGYDGYGVKSINKKEDKSIVSEGKCIAEKRLDIWKEISVIVARGVDGKQKTYDPLDMYFNSESNQATIVHHPAKIDSKLKKQCTTIAKKISRLIEHVGVMAVEFIICKEGEIYINELAPRPHNSGHLTIENNITSQFEQHIRAILELPLGDIEENYPFASMVNIVGNETDTLPTKHSDFLSLFKIEKSTLHLYGKPKSKQNRKMGHITIIDQKNTLQTAKKILKNL